MKQLVINAPFEMKELVSEAPIITKSSEVLLKITHVGICGTDTHAFSGKQPFFSYPRVLGHELAATVEAIGSSVENIKVGDLVTVIPYISCRECGACKRGRNNCCESMQVLGVHIDGGMSEYLVIDEEYVLAGNDLSGELLAIIEPLAIGLHAVKRSRLTQEDTVLVIGAGPIGVGAARFAKLQGATVVLMDIDEGRLVSSKDWVAADHVINPTLNDNVEEQLHALLGGVLPTVVLEATGNRQSMESSFRYVSHGGTLVFVGLVRGDITFNDPAFHARELTLKASRNATLNDFEDVLSYMRSGDIQTGYLTKKISFDEAIDYFSRQKYIDNKVQILF